MPDPGDIVAAKLHKPDRLVIRRFRPPAAGAKIGTKLVALNPAFPSETIRPRLGDRVLGTAVAALIWLR
jgi:SOS-response transcriptional repressor LexA